MRHITASRWKSLKERDFSLEEGRVSWRVWEELAEQMDRRPEQIYRRWIYGIEHVLTRHAAGGTTVLNSF